MEFMKMGNRLETLIKWHPMSERPKESGTYLVIWHTPAGTYLVAECLYSKEYNLFGCDKSFCKDAYEAIKRSEEGYAGKHEENLCGWYENDFTECFEEGEF